MGTNFGFIRGVPFFISLIRIYATAMMFFKLQYVSNENFVDFFYFCPPMRSLRPPNNGCGWICC